jgi:hypothetical protein
MEKLLEPHRCPKCNALVVDRRSAICTTCHEPLPAEWLMTPEQIAKVTELDAHARAEHNALMTDLDNIPTDSGDRL